MTVQAVKALIQVNVGIRWRNGGGITSCFLLCPGSLVLHGKHGQFPSWQKQPDDAEMAI